MSALDLYAPDFPHGTREGYEGGCRGSGACTNHNTQLMTCHEAQVRWNGDMSYRKMVARGLTPQQVFEEDQATVAAVKAAGGGKKPAPVPQPRFTERITELTREPVVEDVHAGMTDAQRISHYRKGCREQQCKDAVAAYQRAYQAKYKARKKAEADAAAAAQPTDHLDEAENGPDPTPLGTTSENDLDTAVAEHIPAQELMTATSAVFDLETLLDLNEAQRDTIATLQTQLRTREKELATVSTALTTALDDIQNLLNHEQPETPALAEVIDLETGGGPHELVVDRTAHGLTLHLTINVGR